MGKQKQAEFCPVARTLDVVGDRWSLLIVRDAFDGIRRFGEFQRNLGIARNILSDRLQKLVEAGVLEVAPASDGTAYQEYLLTARGRDLFTVVVGLRQWGEHHLYVKGEARSSLVEADSGKPVPQLVLRRRDGSALKPEETVVRKVQP
ncbi:winged helix-turn-helix transcriptional regulator [Pseudoduganella violacea]|uniref:DNA-binding HxlR family transcriptional regulator n=1 Tax=Pseudoduganella violacea TaxID=1715466 RepID=A0A7W5BAT9_9BURK|nr:helix-turn-helix domain-containing protein [Pseudoduganella violacea]MBB3119501.1 DNA-binding HxlR family transcriptional regulator [Pseudoduganella violacea]